MRAMKSLAVVMLMFVVGCSGSSPTAPTPPVAVVPPVVTPPVTPPAVTPPPIPAPNPLLSDPRYSLAFYKQLALNGFESPNALEPLKRFTQAPTIFLWRVDDAGVAIDQKSLDTVAAALINVAGTLTGGTFGLAGLQYVTGANVPGPNTIVVRWAAHADPTRCGFSAIGGTAITLYPKTPNCGCDGASVRPMTVKHELGHALGYYHTDSQTDLMFGGARSGCDLEPSEREQFHMRLAYSQPVGSLDP